MKNIAVGFVCFCWGLFGGEEEEGGGVARLFLYFCSLFSVPQTDNTAKRGIGHRIH